MSSSLGVSRPMTGSTLEVGLSSCGNPGGLPVRRHGPGIVRILLLHGPRPLEERPASPPPLLLVPLRDMVGVFDEPRRLHNVQRLHGRRQVDGDQRLGMQRNRCGEPFQVGGVESGRGRRRGRGIVLRVRHARSEQTEDAQDCVHALCEFVCYRVLFAGEVAGRPLGKPARFRSA